VQKKFETASLLGTIVHRSTNRSMIMSLVAHGRPLAYHLTIAAHGARLHGDDRPTVDKLHNEYGSPFLPNDPVRVRIERDRMAHDAVTLTYPHRAHIETVIPAICARGNWDYHAAAAAPNHVHTLLSTESDPYDVRKWFKRWLGESLEKKWPLKSAPRWWADGGSIKHVWNTAYFHQAIDYIVRQRATTK